MNENPVTILSELRRQGVRLTVDGDNLRYSVAKGTLNPTILETLREHKQSLIPLLRKHPKVGGYNEPSAVPVPMDPRPDLVSDSALWSRLLQAAKKGNQELYWTIQGFRCFGARLSKDTGTLRIVYDADQEGFENEADFNKDYQEWVEPHQTELDALLAEVSR